MTKPIQAELDLYGAYARGSALADFVEVCALRGIALSKSDLETLDRKSSWFRKTRGMFTRDVDDELDEDGDEVPWADWTWSILQQRSDELGELYPFSVTSDDLVASSDAAVSDYVRLLSVTLAHAYGVTATVDPRTLFELLVVGALGQIGALSFGMGTATTRGASFPVQLSAAGKALGFAAQPSPNPAHRFAKDGGVDAIARLGWIDQRLGNFFFIVQVTCAASTEWERKISEPRIDHWYRYMNESTLPISGLAVPHHVEDGHFELLIGQTKTVVDRLRLVGRLPAALAGESELLDWLMNAPINVEGVST